MQKPNFQNLRVYCLSESLADTVWDIVAGWQAFPRETIGRQLVRATDSVGANIAEARARGSFQDNRRCVRIARGSLAEVQHWLRRAYNRNLLSHEDVQRVNSTADELGPKLNAYLKSIGTAPHNGQRTTDN